MEYVYYDCLWNKVISYDYIVQFVIACRLIFVTIFTMPRVSGVLWAAHAIICSAWLIWSTLIIYITDVSYFEQMYLLRLTEFHFTEFKMQDREQKCFWWNLQQTIGYVIACARLYSVERIFSGSCLLLIFDWIFIHWLFVRLAFLRHLLFSLFFNFYYISLLIYIHCIHLFIMGIIIYFNIYILTTWFFIVCRNTVLKSPRHWFCHIVIC
jgi:hypothetical protein